MRGRRDGSETFGRRLPQPEILRKLGQVRIVH